MQIANEEPVNATLKDLRNAVEILPDGIMIHVEFGGEEDADEEG